MYYKVVKRLLSTNLLEENLGELILFRMIVSVAVKDFIDTKYHPLLQIYTSRVENTIKHVVVLVRKHITILMETIQKYMIKMLKVS